MQDMSPFTKYALLMNLDPIQTVEYLAKVQLLLIEVDGLPLAHLASRLHDFFLAEAAMICMRRADQWHLQYWQHAKHHDSARMACCERLRDEAVACRDVLRRHLHNPLVTLSVINQL